MHLWLYGVPISQLSTENYQVDQLILFVVLLLLQILKLFIQIGHATVRALQTLIHARGMVLPATDMKYHQLKLKLALMKH